MSMNNRAMRRRRIGQLLTVEEVAEYCAVSMKTIYRALNRGELVGSKIGAQWRIAGAELVRWIEQQQAGSVPRPERMKPIKPGGLRELAREHQRKAV